MKKLLVLLLFIVITISFSFSQSVYKIEGILKNKVSNIGISNYTVFLESDTVYNPNTQQNWHFSKTLTTGQNGFFKDSIFIPQGINQTTFHIYVIELFTIVDTFVTFSSSHPNHFVTLRINNTNTNCKADFQVSQRWDTNNQDMGCDLINLSSGNLNKFYWTFGDGHSSTNAYPMHSYNNEGIYSIWLFAEDTLNNCSDPIHKTLDIKFPEKCRFGINAYKIFDTFYLNAIDSYSNNNTQFSWDFGDNSTAYGKYVKHRYNYYGTYKITLTAVDTSISCSTLVSTSIYYYKTTQCISHFKYYYFSGDTIVFYADSATSPLEYYWDFGNGDFDTGWKVIREYAPGDSVFVCLTKKHGTDTCIKYCENFVCPNTLSNGRISVHVRKNNNWITNHATAYLISFNPNDSSLSAIRTSNNFTNGLIIFDSVPYGTYLIKFALDSANIDYHNFLPTYWSNSLFWNQASTISLSSNSKYHSVSFQLISGYNPGGPGFIGGKVSQGANAPGDAMKDVEIILLDETNQPVLYDMSSNLGNFDFPDLPYGTYTIYPEVAGKYPITKTVTIDQQNPEIRNVRVSVNTKSVSVEFVENLSGSIKNIGKIYPNPTAGNASLNIVLKKNIKLEINTYDALGKKVNSKNHMLNKGSHQLTIHTSHLKNGFYYIEIISSEGYKMTQKLMKQD